MICNEWMDHNPVPVRRHWWSRRVSLVCIYCERELGSAKASKEEAAAAIYSLTMERLYQRGLGWDERPRNSGDGS